MMRLSDVLILSAAVLFAGCGKKVTSPEQPDYSVQGILTVEGCPNASAASVRLFAAPRDEMLQQILVEHPAAGISPITPTLFDPLNQIPVSVIQPDSAGHFLFNNLAAGSFVIDADLEGYGCPQPVFVNVPEASSAGTLSLAVMQPVSGSLGNVVWTTGSAYQLIGNVTFQPSTELVIQEGVLIEVAGDYSIYVYGGIRVDGVPGNPVRFRLSRAHFQAGGDWGGLRLEQPVSSCHLTGMLVQDAATALRVVGGSAEIRECLLDKPSGFGAYFSGGAQGLVENCVVRDGYQGLVADNCSPHFDHNLILRMSLRGILIKAYSQVSLSGNVLRDCQTGIWSEWYTSPTIEYNLVSGGDYGLDAQRGFSATVRYNEFRQQSRSAVYFHIGYCYPYMQYNNFFEMPDTIFYVNGSAAQQTDTVYAPNNYWDGRESDELANSIVAGLRSGSQGNPVGPVIYEPYFMQPNQEVGP
jgi:hypothetical protein